ncbi:DUF3107 domain-containing protein [Brooklawnia cerclae]|uniref:DUF3107 domain-containing protein n=1 Tax=Brooklawnia cerclae TaxID=349934 RepID=A0ABX0SEC2_9ACTN|nr:hypothetical protein [Brooklawnia cerclae]
MEIRIGVQNIGRELTVETDKNAAQLEKGLREALATEDGLFVVEATKGRKLLIPADQIGYVDLGQELTHPVGFGFGSDEA